MMSELQKILPEKKNLEENSEEEDENRDLCAKQFDYLLSMPLWSLTEEKLTNLKQQLNEKEQAYQ